MNMTAFIDVAIGLTLLYLGTSLFVTIINEYLAQVGNLRARHLKRALDKLFSRDGLEAVLADYKNLIHAQKSGATDQSFISRWLERIGLKWPSDQVGSYIDTKILAQWSCPY